MTTHIQLSAYLMTIVPSKVPYFIEYNAHTSIVRTWISQWFWAKKFISFFKNIITIINHYKFNYHKSYLRPFLSYFLCIVRREYFSIIFNIKKCTLFSIKYSNYFIFGSFIFSEIEQLVPRHFIHSTFCRITFFIVVGGDGN